MQIGTNHQSLFQAKGATANNLEKKRNFALTECLIIVLINGEII